LPALDRNELHLVLLLCSGVVFQETGVCCSMEYDIIGLEFGCICPIKNGNKRHWKYTTNKRVFGVIIEKFIGYVFFLVLQTLIY
jgi:hypothetical protein